MSQVTAAPRTARLKCVAGKGMFSLESGVVIKGVNRQYEAMIDREFVHGAVEFCDSDVPAWIEIDVIQSNGSRLLVELPRQVVSGGRRIWVPESEIEN